MRNGQRHLGTKTTVEDEQRFYNNQGGEACLYQWRIKCKTYSKSSNGFPLRITLSLENIGCELGRKDPDHMSQDSRV